MKLIKLSVSNFATYEKGVIDFKKLKYPVFVEGKTGSGKTTLFVDAITMALYGTAYGEKSPKLAKESIMKDKNKARVELDFELNGKIYRVSREIHKRDTNVQDARLFEIDPVTGKPRQLTYGKKNVDNYIYNLLGLKFETLMLSAIVRQGDVYRFLDLTPAKRRDFIMEILKLGVFEKFKEKAREMAKEKEKEVEALKREIILIQRDVENLPRLEEELRKLEEELPGLKEEKRRLEEEIMKHEQEIEELRKKLIKLSEKIGEKKNIEQRLNRLREEERRLSNEIKSIEKILGDFDTSILEEISNLKVMITNAKNFGSQITLLEEQIKQTNKLLEKKKKLETLEAERKMLEPLVSDLEELRAKKEDLSGKIQVNKTKIKEIEDHIKELEKGEGRCPVCGAPLSEERKKERKRELEEEKKKLEEKLKVLFKEIRELEDKIRSKKNKENMLRRIEGKIKNLQSDLRGKEPEKELEKLMQVLEEKRKEYHVILEKIESMLKTRNLNEAENAVTKLERMKRQQELLKTKKNELERIELEIIELTDALNAMPDYDEEFETLNTKLEKYKEQLKSLKKSLDTIREEIAKTEANKIQIEKTIGELKQKTVILENKRKETEELEKDILALKTLEDKVFHPSTLPTKLLKEFLKVIQEYANEYLQRAFGQDIEIKLELVPSRTDKEKIEMTLYHQNYERDIKTFSGGETTLIGFAIRLAIGKLLTSIQETEARPRFLIIDEGFGPLDEELRVKVAEALTGLLENGEYEQIIMISHEAELKDSPLFQSVIRIEKVNNRSQLVAEPVL